jgi:hypothetical protein
VHTHTLNTKTQTSTRITTSELQTQTCSDT